VKEVEDLDFEGEGKATFRFEHLSKILSQSFWGKGSDTEDFLLLTMENGDSPVSSQTNIQIRQDRISSLS
jgi:hypothetical protein